MTFGAHKTIATRSCRSATRQGHVTREGREFKAIEFDCETILECVRGVGGGVRYRTRGTYRCRPRRSSTGRPSRSLDDHGGGELARGRAGADDVRKGGDRRNPQWVRE